MKGSCFQSQCELKLQVEGESWRQGDVLQGTLTVRNHGPAEIPMSEFSVLLGHADFKSVAAKDPGAFEVLTTREGGAGVAVAPGAEERLDWSVPLDINCPVTDKSTSLYLVYGRKVPAEWAGTLQLRVEPRMIVQEFLKVLQIEFRFVQKFIKHRKGRSDVKLQPPSSKSLAAVDHLMLSFRTGPSMELEVNWAFQLRKIDASAGSMAMSKEKLEVNRTFVEGSLGTPGGRIDPDRIRVSIEEILKQIEAAPRY